MVYDRDISIVWVNKRFYCKIVASEHVAKNSTFADGVKTVSAECNLTHFAPMFPFIQWDIIHFLVRTQKFPKNYVHVRIRW